MLLTASCFLLAAYCAWRANQTWALTRALAGTTPAGRFYGVWFRWFWFLSRVYWAINWLVVGALVWLNVRLALLALLGFPIWLFFSLMISWTVMPALYKRAVGRGNSP